MISSNTQMIKNTSLVLLFSLFFHSLFAQPFLIADTHNDVLSGVVMRGTSIEQDLRGRAHTDLSRLEKSGVGIQVFSIFCNERYGKGRAYNRAIAMIDSLDAIVKRNPTLLMAVNSPAELTAALQSGKIAAMKGVEGGHMIEDRLDYLDSLYRRGARYLTLTWNNSVPWASSAADESKGALSAPGLNEFGQKVIRRMNELGMMIDVSHVGEATFNDAIRLSTMPIIASHSSSYALCPHPRNLKDDQLKAIAKNGGVIFINFYSGFIDSNYMRRKAALITKYKPETDSLKAAGMTNYGIDEWLAKKYSAEFEAIRPTLDQLIDHIDHIVKVAGIDHVGLGSDFDGIESAPKGIDGVDDYQKIPQALLQRGYSKEAVEKIASKNFIRVFEANQPN